MKTKYMTSPIKIVGTRETNFVVNDFTILEKGFYFYLRFIYFFEYDNTFLILETNYVRRISQNVDGTFHAIMANILLLYCGVVEIIIATRYVIFDLLITTITPVSFIYRYTYYIVFSSMIKNYRKKKYNGIYDIILLLLLSRI